MFASGIFIDSFSPTSSADEQQSIINAIKAFKANLVIVLDNRPLEMRLRKQNNTEVVFLNAPASPMINQVDPYCMFQEYFLGKNYKLMQRKESLQAKIQGIKMDVDR